MQGERLGLYDSAFGVILMVLFTTTLFIVAVARTARVVQRSEEKRLAAERRLAAVADEIADLYENAPIGYHSLDRDGLFVRINRTELEMLGYEAQELIGKRRLVDLMTPDGQERFRVNFPRFKETGVVRDLEFELIRRDGSIKPVRISATAARDEAGEFLSSRSRVQDISDQRRIEAEREQAREDAETANRAKSEFLSRMSHDLRTPLNSVLGFAQPLEMGDLEPAHRDNVHYIARAGRHLLDLINEVLDISRIETGQLTLSIEPVDLGEVLAEATALVGPLASQRGIDLASVASTAGGPYVLADRQRLRQVFLNILSNAVKYNHDGGSVAVGIAELGGRIVVTIKDSGPGIMPGDRERLFVPFERLGAEHTEVEGAGVGLALTKSLVEAMRGQIGFDSIPGSGTSFWVSFEPTEAPASTTAAAPAGELASSPGARRRMVLCIEDNVANLRLVERLLSRIPDTDLIQAIQGTLRVALARQHRPDVILLDLHLPDLSGEEVLQQLQADPASRHIPVVVVTADGNPRRLRRVLELGAAAHVTKPIDVPEFMAVLAATMAEGPGVADVA